VQIDGLKRGRGWRGPWPYRATGICDRGILRDRCSEHDREYEAPNQTLSHERVPSRNIRFSLLGMQLFSFFLRSAGIRQGLHMPF
jgi:hypothetical protein